MNIWRIAGVDYIIPWDFATLCKVTRATVYNWIRYNGMPAIRSEGGRFLIPLEDALKWVEKYKS